MTDEITRTMIDDHGFGGLGLGAGFLGGLIIGNMWNGSLLDIAQSATLPRSRCKLCMISFATYLQSFLGL
jgi:hypothetical protein